MALDLERIEQLIAEWRALQPLPAELDQKLWEKLRLEWNYNSNHIEGNTLTYKETEMYLLRGQTSGVHVEREYVEMKGHDYAIEIVRELARGAAELTEADVRNLNQVILKQSFYKNAIMADGRPARKEIVPGRYKTEPNSVLLENGEIFPYADPIDVPTRMAKLMEVIRKSAEKDGLEFLATLAITHHEFVLIHPFDDGNGRVSRLLMNYVLMKKGLPPLVVPSKRKPDYLKALQQADSGDVALLTDFIGEQLIWSLELGIKASNGESLEDPNDVEKEIALFVREQKHKKREITRRTPETMRKFLTSSIVPLFRAFDEKTALLSELFEERTLQLSSEGRAGRTEWQQGIAQIAEELDTRLPSQINLFLQLNGYLGEARRPFSMGSHMQVQMTDYEFTIHLQGGGKVRLYSDGLKKEEIDQLIGEYLKKLLVIIKNRSAQA